MTARDGPYSQSRLATYLKCQRMFEYDYEWDVSSPETTQRYLIQGNVFHRTVEETCESARTDMRAEEVYEMAMGYFPAIWTEEVIEDEFESAAQREYYRRVTLAALEDYFDPDDGAGIEHARRSIAVEEHLETTVDGIPVKGYIDNILATDDGVHIIDYKRSRGSMISGGTADRLAGHLDGSEYEPGRVKSAIQGALYIQAVRDSNFCKPGDQVRFTYYVYLYDDEFVPDPEGYRVEARGKAYDRTELLAEYDAVIWDLIASAEEGIRTGSFEPVPWETIRDETCDDCDYKAMCADYLESEVGRR